MAVKTAPLSIPASPKIDGLTKRIYAIETKVVKPAKNSRLIEEPLSVMWKARSIPPDNVRFLFTTYTPLNHYVWIIAHNKMKIKRICS